MPANPAGDKSLSFKRGQDLSAADMNRIVDGLLKRLVGLPPISVNPIGRNLGISLGALGGPQVVPDRLSGIISSEVDPIGSPGVYTWEPFASGPGQSAVLVDSGCVEYNLSIGILPGTVVVLNRENEIGDADGSGNPIFRWWFFFPVAPCSGGGGD